MSRMRAKLAATLLVVGAVLVRPGLAGALEGPGSVPSKPQSGSGLPADAAAPPHVAPEGIPAPPAPMKAGVPTRSAERPPPGRTRALTVPRTAVAPTLDGALDDAAWKGAAV